MTGRRRENGQFASVSEYADLYVPMLYARLEAKSSRAENGCIEWAGAKTHNGYGQIRVRLPRPRLFLVHRLAWILTHGDPGPLDVCHRCDNPSCLNVEHLFVGTRSENMQDMSAKRRYNDSRGEKSGRAVLTDDDVARIKAMREAGKSQREIGDSFGVHPSHVCRILSRKRWPHK